MSAAAPSKPLKSHNLPWLCAMVSFDVLTVAALVVPAELAGASLTVSVALRAAALPALPLVVWLLSSLLPSSMKAALVFWRFKHALPGHRAFTKYAVADPRVNVSALQRRFGRLPTAPRDQNTAWYRLYREVADEPSVVHANRAFLLFRDSAALSLLLVFMVPLLLFVFDSSVRVAWTAAALFLVQYLLTAVAARHNGVALVTNVLALHGTARKAGSKKR